MPLLVSHLLVGAARKLPSRDLGNLGLVAERAFLPTADKILLEPQSWRENRKHFPRPRDRQTP